MTDDAAALAATYFRAWKAYDFEEFRSIRVLFDPRPLASDSSG